MAKSYAGVEEGLRAPDPGTGRRRLASRAGRPALGSLALLAVAFGVVSSAGAARQPLPVETSAIRRTVESNWHSLCASQPFDFRGAKISTADPRYAVGLVKDNACYTVGWVLRRPTATSEYWRLVLQLGDSLPSCSAFKAIPRAVTRDLGFRGEPAGGGDGVVQC